MTGRPAGAGPAAGAAEAAAGAAEAGRRAAARAALEAWEAPTEPAPGGDAGAREDLRRRYLAHLELPGSLDKHGLPDHLTASALVLDPTGRRTLLVLHRRGGFWVQPGGHLEPGDAAPRAAARRELAEETGLAGSAVDVSEHPVDLDHHRLGGAFGGCRSHLDMAYLAVADPAAAVAVSAESDRVAWWPVDGLPDGADGGPAVVADLPARLRAAARGLVQRG